MQQTKRCSDEESLRKEKTESTAPTSAPDYGTTYSTSQPREFCPTLVDKEGKKYEIKTRKASTWNKPTIFPAKEEQLKKADYVVYVEFDNDWNLAKLLKIPTNEVRPNAYDRVVINKELVRHYSVLDECNHS